MSLSWIITLGIGFVALLLALTRSALAVDLMVYVFVFNRGVRRLVDYYVHYEFQRLSPISLAPLIVAAAMLLAALMQMERIPWSSRVVLLCVGGAAAYAFGIGFLNVQFAAVYALAEAMAPLGLFGYVLLLRPTVAVRDRWVRSFAWAAILVSAYGWYQYLTIPVWDKFWLIETEMYGYMGIPEPTKMTVFSTMAERGVLAGFLGFSVVPMIVSRRWRPMPGLLGWAGVILVFSVILLTLSRGGLLFALIGTVTYLIINRGQGAKQIALAAAVLGVAAWFGMERIPNAERVTERYESLGEMSEDDSFQGRVEIMSYGLPSLLREPLGRGLGASGLAGRLVTSPSRGAVVDAGWFNILLIYGIPGTALLLGAMISAWRILGDRFRDERLRDGHVLLGRAMMITLIPTCFVGDLLTGFSIFWLALGCGIALRPGPAVVPRRRPGEIPVSAPVPRAVKTQPRPQSPPRSGSGTGHVPSEEPPPPSGEAEEEGFWLKG